MTIRAGQSAPDFEQDTANGSIRFHAWLGTSWCMLFNHPHNFAPIFADELAAVAHLASEWARHGVKPLCLTPETAETLVERVTEIEAGQGCTIDFPLIADCDHAVATLYGLADPAAGSAAVVVIDPAKIVRLVMIDTGRNFAELLGMIESLKLGDADGVVMPKSSVAP